MNRASPAPAVPVAITGVGAITAVGRTARDTFAALCRGDNGITAIESWRTAGFPVDVGGVVPDYDPVAAAEPAAAPFKSRKAVFALTAAREAIAEAGATFAHGGRGGLFFGVETGRIDIRTLFKVFVESGTPRGLDLAAFGRRSFAYLTPAEALSKQPFWLPALVANQFGLRGEARAVTNACSSANQAIGEAYRKIAEGELDWALTGGADDMIDPYMAIGFHRLGALATGLPPEAASRPFDAARRGFVLGEGAGMLVFESLPHALARGAQPLALLTGYASSASATRITETTADGIQHTMAAALAEAGVPIEAIDYINAHGTGTPMNDPAETLAIKRLFGDHARKIAVSATKSMIGHLIAAAGAVEAVVTTLSIAEGRIHPTRNLTRPDPACDLDYVPEGCRALSIRHALSNSLGFAGINSTLLFSRAGAAAHDGRQCLVAARMATRNASFAQGSGAVADPRPPAPGQQS